METYRKEKVHILLMAMAVLVMFQASVALAQEGSQVGAQICVPPNANQLQTLEYSPRGVLNTNTEPRWVICPLTVASRAGRLDGITRLTNLSDETLEAGTVLCIYRLTNQLGQIVATLPAPTDAPIPPNVGVSIIVANFPTDFGDNITASCQLPPNWQIVSFTIRPK